MNRFGKYRFAHYLTVELFFVFGILGVVLRHRKQRDWQKEM